ncbi:recombinase family protein, partial [Clostridium perfringens]
MDSSIQELIKGINRVPKVGIYCRVSTSEQAETGYSIDEQERLLIDWCNKNRLEVFNCYSDRGISGKSIKNRPELKALLKDVEDKKVDVVISWKLNRISRKLEDILKIMNLLEKNNVTFKSYSEPFQTTTH